MTAHHMASFTPKTIENHFPVAVVRVTLEAEEAETPIGSVSLISSIMALRHPGFASRRFLYNSITAF